MLSNFFTNVDEKAVEFISKLPKELYFLECDGKVFNDIGEIGHGRLIQIHYRVCGGKGGFGSLLRSFRIHKSSNQLMCRNLQGRRLADVKEEERLKKYISKKAEREKEKQRKKNEKIDRLKSGGTTKHHFADQNYLRKRDTLLDEVEDAIEAGMTALEQKASPTNDEEPIAGCSYSYENTIQKDAMNKKEEELQAASSDSDVDLDAMMNIGPLKKKRKLN